MRHLQRNQRGSTLWAFVICLLLLLVFVYLWYDEKGKRETADDGLKEAELQRQEMASAAASFRDYMVALSTEIGWVVTPAESLLGPDASNTAKQIADGQRVTDIAMVIKNLTPTGEFEADGVTTPGLLKVLNDDAELTIAQDMRSASGDQVTESPAKFDWMTPEFVEKLKRLDTLEAPVAPLPPADADDTGAQDDYEDALRTYEEHVASNAKAIEEAQADPLWKKYDKMIRLARTFNPATQRMVTLEFFVKPPTGKVTVEEVFRYPPLVIAAVLSEFKKNKEADAGTIEQLRQDVQAKVTRIAELETALSEEEGRHAADQERLQEEVTQATSVADAARFESTQAQQRVQALESEIADERQAAAEEVAALINRIRVDKDVRDLKVRRNDPDGIVLSASATMNTGTINLGSRDRVFPGLRFTVSRIGRGAVRSDKGEVMVTRVLGPKSSKISIVGVLDPRNPITTGDLITNPFYDAKDTIHVWIVGELEKYPLSIVKERLGKMHVVVDAEINGKTDYVVVPNSMSAPAPAAEDEDDMGDEGVGTKSQFEKVQDLAQKFGATVITERLLNSFLNY